MERRVISELWSLYEKGEFESLREKAISILGLIKPDKLIDSLITELKEEQVDVRRRAADAPGSIGSEKAIEPLKQALTDEVEYYREKVKDASFAALEKISRRNSIRITRRKIIK